MKTIAASTLGLILLVIVSFVSLKVSEASVSSSSQTAQPTPPANKSKEKVSVPSASCSPHPTPLSESEKNNPLREMSLEEYVNLSLGTPDFDCDGVCNFRDNCQSVYNPDQKDGNADGIGDACDPKLVDRSFIDSRCDMDGDGIPDIKDNCPSACNPDQKFVDLNENKVNDLCDAALPNFAFDKPCKNRIEVKPPKTHAEQNKWIDPCEGDPGCDPFGEISERYLRLDSDGDGIPDYKDNCSIVCNSNPKDADKNGIGDACDPALGNSVYISTPCRKSKKLKT